MTTIYSDWAYQKTRVYWDERYVEVEWSIGPIPIEYVLSAHPCPRA